MGVDLQIVNLPFAELESALRKGRIDMIMSGMSITPERARTMTFVGPYMMSGKSLVTRAGLLEDADDTGDIDNPAVKIAVLGRSTSESFVREYAPKSQVVIVANYEEAVRKLIDGEVAAMVADMPACSFALLRHPDAGLIALEEPLRIEPIGIAVDARDAEFGNLLQNYVDTIEGSDLGASLAEKWFANDAWLSRLP
jgi:polar amino acid transport system substrate-binding protein